MNELTNEYIVYMKICLYYRWGPWDIPNPRGPEFDKETWMAIQ